MIARQFTLGVVQTADGLPLYHEVFNPGPVILGVFVKSLIGSRVRTPGNHPPF